MLALSEAAHLCANGAKALDKASLAIPKGMSGLLGPNGAGKTTLMRCIATLPTPSGGRPQLIIVDESTAGLDPEERNRFNNLIAEIGESIVVILSTHIVDDVADLCSQMAIINGGRIVCTGPPGELLRALQGRVWRRTVAKLALEDYRSRLEVISTRLCGGQTIIHVVADQQPEAGFEPVAGELQDLYFATLAQERRRAAA
jgi:ABC-type multidrug transport system ATPase subunit